MSVRIRLKRMGAKKRPYYRIVVMDSSSPRDGRAIEELGYYHPVERQNQVKINKNKFQEWVDKGAIPSDTVKRILNKSNFKVDN
ncbi:SSU ribosomal protein S16P [Borrelia duttonii CR2A]|uniref:Small ribosomal subunit protein bS16 n=5 Tax=Borrelia TaxID=138 RepID=RS16_BORDL|nr:MULTISPECIES: 30S ribosomal protein S16 [Borrelia]B5RMP0.1 RecName: Full=Small ribosomal subunit protein bS16; AltName: Full=30S ribosomal protein S16 [Borrelia duttonii Ly]B5RQ36.1 RecName: Full=Small ribosomal subunit protein bS16; AltName: Full=30S ribosomal protein S16 [Borrelia recurrentis A1]ACH93626.1 30S ribosomal protein S16 [Borrelia duttonii Ly]ACH94920.1 30S ribosomal protein S16 [Borrelia recurrentis A1]AFI31482.1 30S ribosomal protein S16 [Borrelia crocidurae str. Achema]AHH0